MSKRYPAISRRAFLRLMTLTGVGTALTACGHRDAPLAADVAAIEAEPAQPAGREPAPVSEMGQPHLAVARGEDPAALTLAALTAIGGIERFVKNGASVIIKPNICTASRSPEQAATTNPAVVATLVQLCLGAGARSVRVMDFPFGGTAQQAYESSGIAVAVGAAGGEMEIMNPLKFKPTPIPRGQDIDQWSVYQDILNVDVVINVPIAKHHSLARLTLGGKNLLGVIEARSRMHANLGQRIADLASLVRPTLTVVDAYRILMNHGPTGGSLDDVRLAQTVIASHDMVAADAYAATLFELKGEDIAYVKAAAEMGLGSLDLAALKIEEIAI